MRDKRAFLIRISICFNLAEEWKEDEEWKSKKQRRAEQKEQEAKVTLKKKVLEHAQNFEVIFRRSNLKIISFPQKNYNVDYV